MTPNITDLDFLRTEASDGQCFAVFGEIDLPHVDEALGTTAERAAADLANADGLKLVTAFREAQNAWPLAHPEIDYPGGREDWVKAIELACRPLKAPIAAATTRSYDAVTALYAAQQRAFRSRDARARLATRFLQVDAIATVSLTAWDAALGEREALGRLLQATGDGSGTEGRGHWSRSSALTSIGPDAIHQRTQAEIVTRVSPRATVARMIPTAPRPASSSK